MKLNNILDKKIKREILICDIIAWATFSMMIILRFLTVFSINKTTELTNADITQTISYIEANPIAGAIFKLKGISQIVQFAIIPGAFMTFYYYMRRRVKLGLYNIESLSLLTNFGFFCLLLNIINDASVVLALYLR